jgi:nucleoside-diphosphate-sugar epimerase
LHIVLTGGTGFIGSQLQQFLVSSGHTVTVYIRENSAKNFNILKSCSSVEGSLTDLEKISTLTSQCDLVIYCAGSVRGARLKDFFQANVAGLKTFGTALATSGGRLLLISSLAAERPHLSDYANTKYLGETVLESIEGLRWCVLRPPAVYGASDTELRPLFKLMNKGIALTVGPKDQRLSLLHVEDLARAVCMVAISPSAFNGRKMTLHDGKEGGYLWCEIVRATRPIGIIVWIRLPQVVLIGFAKINMLLASIFGYLPMLSPGKVSELSEKAWVCDNASISELCGWRPRVDLQQGIRKTLEKS